MFTFDYSMLNTTLILSLLIFVSYKYLTYSYDYWRRRNVSYFKPILFFGSIKDVILLRVSLGNFIKKLYDLYPNEKYVGFFSGRNPELVIRDPDLIRLVFVKDFQHFHDRINDVNLSVEPLGGHLVNLEGRKWKLLRQKLTPTFTSGKIKNMLPLVLEKGESLQNYVGKLCEMGKEAEIRDLIARFTTEVIGSCAFGIHTNSLENDDDPFRTMGRRFFEPTTSNSLKRIFRSMSSRLFYTLGLKIIDDEMHEFFVSMLKNIIDERKKTKIQRRDFLDLLLELKEKDNEIDQSKRDIENIELTDMVMAAQAFVFFVAGFETSSSATAFALYELALNQPMQDKLREEIQTIKQKYGGEITYEGIAEMEYLDMVVCESLRKYSVFSIITRICTNEYKVPNTDLVIKKGVRVRTPVGALHYDPKYFPEPEKFIPERFTAEVKSKRHPFSYLPFGEGPRICIAQRFGMIEIKVGIISMLDKFVLYSGNRTEDKLTLDPKSIVTASKHGIWLKIEPYHG